VNAIATLLDLAFDDATSTWQLGPDGAWERRRGDVDLQEELIEQQRRRRA